MFLANLSCARLGFIKWSVSYDNQAFSQTPDLQYLRNICGLPLIRLELETKYEAAARMHDIWQFNVLKVFLRKIEHQLPQFLERLQAVQNRLILDSTTKRIYLLHFVEGVIEGVDIDLGSCLCGINAINRQHFHIAQTNWPPTI